MQTWGIRRGMSLLPWNDNAALEGLSMKAIVYTKYGSPDVLRLREVEKPSPKDGEVLIKVHAASVNSWDWDLLRGKPLLNRLGGLFRPQYRILGCDVAGRVEAIGGHVEMLHPGDEVFGDISGCGWGGFAEYVCADEKILALKSADMTFEEAAAIPQGAVMALQGIRDMKPIQKGSHVLINGAGGCVGTFAVQIAKAYGAVVTAVDSAEKLEMLRSIGADHVIDYTQNDFTTNGKSYDLILDVVARRSVPDYRRALALDGIAVLVGGASSSILKAALFGSGEGAKVVLLMHKPNKKDLETMNKLFETGKVFPIIDKCFSLGEVPDALRSIGEGRAKGKLVISVDGSERSNNG
jgi:NADPH:quinone reductase-like Zn-dependent oxidoreductase